MAEDTSTAVQEVEKENSPADFAVSENGNDSLIFGFPQTEDNPAQETSLEGNSAEINEILNECEQIEIEPNSSPVEIRAGQMAFVPSVSLGYGTCAAITSNGDLYCWGNDREGQVGNGAIEKQATPVKVLSNVISVSGLESGTMAAVTDNGDLYCWGYNAYGRVGNGGTEDQNVPIKVLNDVASVSVPI